MQSKEFLLFVAGMILVFVGGLCIGVGESQRIRPARQCDGVSCHRPANPPHCPRCPHCRRGDTTGVSIGKAVP